MKKIVCIILAFALVMAVTACAAPAAEPEAPVEDAAVTEVEDGCDLECAPQPEMPVGLPNPMVDQEDASGFESLGLYIDAPDDSTDIKYFVVADEYAQVMFTADGATYNYRASKIVDVETLHGIYETFDETEKSVDMDGMDFSIRIRTIAGGTGGSLATWSIGDINFTVSTANEVEEAAFEAMVTGLAGSANADCTGAHPDVILE